VLLQSVVSKLHPETTAVYVHAATKVFASWAAETAKRWDNDDLPKVKQQVDYVVERLQEFAANPNIEVQERVRIFGMEQRIRLILAKGRKLSRTFCFHQCRPFAVQTTAS
jgi:hypothetical protein